MKSKKSRLLTAVAGILLSAVAVSVFAANGTSLPRDPVQPWGGYWKGTYKYLSPYTAPDGTHYSYKYVDVVGTTQAYCQQQLQGTIVYDCAPMK